MLRIYSCNTGLTSDRLSRRGGALRSSAMRHFVDIGLGREPAPDEKTVCEFRHLMEAHELSTRLFETIAEQLQKPWYEDQHRHDCRCTIILAPSSTKNCDKWRARAAHGVWISSSDATTVTLGADCATLQYPGSILTILLPLKRHAVGTRDAADDVKLM